MKNTSIDRLKTALVVIDLQKGVIGRPTAPTPPHIVVQNAAALANGFRKNGMPVFLVRVAFSSDGKDREFFEQQNRPEKRTRQMALL
jgi:nicotinamidase-related amidase